MAPEANEFTGLHLHIHVFDGDVWPDGVGNTFVRPVSSREAESACDQCSQIPYRHLWEVAGGVDREQRLNLALRADVGGGAIGPICADVIRRSGIIPDVMPESPNLPSLVRALGDYYEQIG